MSLYSKLKSSGGPASKAGNAAMKAAAVSFAAQVKKSIKGK